MLAGSIFRGLFESAEAGGRFIFNKGYKEIGTGALFGKPIEGLKSGYKMAFRGAAPFLLPYGAFAAATAPRNHKLGAGVGALAAPIGTFIGGALGGPLGALAGTFILDPLIQSGVGKAVSAFSDFGRNQRRLETGGSFADSTMNWTMRQRAASEMGSSLMNARQILGREAAFFHQ